MNYKKFIEEYNNANDKMKCIHRHITSEYVSYQDKIVQCRKIIDTTCRKTINIKGQERSVFWLDSPMRHMFYIITLLSFYTDIEWNKSVGEDNENLVVFNELSRCGAIYDLIDSIPAFEKAAFDTVLDMVYDDVYENERSIVSYCDSKIDAVLLSLSELKNITSTN